jgi:hypothetical protein
MTRRALILDTETTGLDPATDKVIGAKKSPIAIPLSRPNMSSSSKTHPKTGAS